jgi:Raf kinase inhibitor-like YbhB/YbcL family protein
MEPVLRWRGVPAGTRSFALQVVDPDAKVPRPGFVHWVAYNIPPSWRTLGPGSPHIYTNGKNGTGKIGYIGPCPPIGDPPHHYHFTLYALNVAQLSGPPLTQRALQQSIKGHVLGAATLIGTFQRR